MNDKKTIKLQIRLSEDEMKLFREKSKSYGCNVSGLIRDAVQRFDDKNIKRKIYTMNELLKFYKEYQQRLSWLSGNFNQAMHRANELAIAGELSPQYYNKVLMPMTKEIAVFLRGLKADLTTIHDYIEGKRK